MVNRWFKACLFSLGMFLLLLPVNIAGAVEIDAKYPDPGRCCLAEAWSESELLQNAYKNESQETIWLEIKTIEESMVKHGYCYLTSHR